MVGGRDKTFPLGTILNCWVSRFIVDILHFHSNTDDKREDLLTVP